MISSPNKTPARRTLVMTAACVVLLLASSSPTTYADGGPSVDPASNTRRVTFVQMSAPHLFDAGADRHAEGVEEEALDNRAAFHWAVLETNRLVLAEHRSIDFVVITGGFGLRNVDLSAAPNKNDCPKRERGREGPIAAVSMDEAAAEIARELDALEVRRIYLVPGNDDLCDESPTDLSRWATFVWRLQAELKTRRKTREGALNLGYPEKKDIRVAPPPEVVDLSFTLERLRSALDPSVHDLGDSTNTTIPEPPVVDGFSLLGLDSAYFNSHDNSEIQTASNNQIPKEITFLQNRIQPGGSYLIFTHSADVRDPDPPPANPAPDEKTGKKADKNPDPKANKTADQKPDKQVKPTPDSGSAAPWALPADARKTWHDQILLSTQVIGVFGGHFYSSSRELYPHSFSSPDKLTSAKTWLAPPLAARNQWSLPPEKTARGILLVTVTGNGSVFPTPMWFTLPDQSAVIDGQDKLIQARADEAEKNWEGASTLYAQALTSKDSRVRATAAEGYERCRAITRSWWWQIGKYFPPLRWIAIYPRRMAWLIPILLALLAAFALFRWLRFLYLGELIRFLILPRFRGRALLHVTAEMTKGAPTGEFNAQMLASQEEIRIRLLSEQENWMAGHVALLTPSSESFDTLVSSIPKAGEVNISDYVKFLVQLARAFQWTVDSGVAVFPPDAPPVAPAADPTALPPGGELSAYAVLQWAWLTKNSWRRKVRIVDHSAVRELARELAELILGEAFI